MKGTKGAYDKQSVAIEFANEGPLDLDGDRLYAFGMNMPSTVYNGPFIAYDWRGFGCFAQLDEPQLSVVASRDQTYSQRLDASEY